MRYKTIEDIQKTSHLEVFLTSQYHTGIMDIVDDAQKNYTERERKDIEEKERVQKKIENFKLNNP